MKLRTWAAFTALFTLLSFSAACSRTAKNPVEQLITLCKDGNYKEAAKHLINRYKCTDQNYSAACVRNYENSDDKEEIERDCKSMMKYAGVDYTVGAEQVKQQSGTYYQYDVEVKIGGKTLKEMWFFRKIDGEYVLIDID